MTCDECNKFIESLAKNLIFFLQICDITHNWMEGSPEINKRLVPIKEYLLEMFSLYNIL